MYAKEKSVMFYFVLAVVVEAVMPTSPAVSEFHLSPRNNVFSYVTPRQLYKVGYLSDSCMKYFKAIAKLKT